METPDGNTRCVDDILARDVDSKDHDSNVLRQLETARMNGITLNPKELQFKSTKCELFGNTLTSEVMKSRGHKADECTHSIHSTCPRPSLGSSDVIDSAFIAKNACGIPSMKMHLTQSKKSSSRLQLFRRMPVERIGCSVGTRG